MSFFDHFAEAKLIVDELEKLGVHDPAQDIRRAIDDGVSGTEIFMQLRFHLLGLLNDPRVSDVTKVGIETLIKELNSALS